MINIDSDFFTIMGVSTDSSGGFTLHSFLRALKRALQDTPRVNIIPNDKIIYCSLHNVKNCLQNEIITVLGDSEKNDMGEHIT